MKKLIQMIILDIIIGHKIFFINLYQNLFKMTYEIVYIFLYTLLIHFISFLDQHCHDFLPLSEAQG